MNERRILLFYYFFFTGMFISKTIQPIYWEKIGVINFFGYSYAIMTFMGIFSYLYIYIIKEIGIYRTMLIGSILYSLGLLLRAYPININIAILSGLIAGVGASINLLGIKFWILYFSDEKKKKIISNTNIVYTFAQFSGIILSNLIVILFSLIDLNGYRTSLIISSLFVLIIIFYIPKDIKN